VTRIVSAPSTATSSINGGQKIWFDRAFADASRVDRERARREKLDGVLEDFVDLGVAAAHSETHSLTIEQTFCLLADEILTSYVPRSTRCARPRATLTESWKQKRSVMKQLGEKVLGPFVLREDDEEAVVEADEVK
jgi:hypothetical protein